MRNAWSKKEEVPVEAQVVSVPVTQPVGQRPARMMQPRMAQQQLCEHMTVAACREQKRRMRNRNYNGRHRQIQKQVLARQDAHQPRQSRGARGYYNRRLAQQQTQQVASRRNVPARRRMQQRVLSTQQPVISAAPTSSEPMRVSPAYRPAVEPIPNWTRVKEKPVKWTIAEEPVYQGRTASISMWSDNLSIDQQGVGPKVVRDHKKEKLVITDQSGFASDMQHFTQASWGKATLKKGKKIQHIDGDFMMYGNKNKPWKWNCGGDDTTWKNLAHKAFKKDMHKFCTYKTQHKKGKESSGYGIQPQEILTLLGTMSNAERKATTDLILTSGVWGDLATDIKASGLKDYLESDEFRAAFPALKNVWVRKTFDAITLYNNLVKKGKKVAGLFHMTC